MFDENSNSLVSVVGNIMNVKDNRWLQVEVCREFQRGQCSRSAADCKFSHPPPHVEIQNGKVVACYDNIKGKCNRENPKCKYLHPPQHIKDQLLINGRNNLALKSLLASQISNSIPFAAPTQFAPGIATLQQPAAAAIIPAQYQCIPGLSTAFYPGLYPIAASPDSFHATSLLNSLIPAQSSASASLLAAQQQAQSQFPTAAPVASSASRNSQSSQQSIKKPDRVEALQQQHQQQQQLLAAQQQIAPKRVALDKSGVPVYQPSDPTAAAATLLAFNPAAAGYYPSAQIAALPTNGVHPAAATAYLQSLLSVTAGDSTSLNCGQGEIVNKLSANIMAVDYFDDKGQILDTLPICRDFKQGFCDRAACRYVHLTEDYVDVTNGRVVVCRDHTKNKCNRPKCRYYHVPVLPFQNQTHDCSSPTYPPQLE